MHPPLDLETLHSTERDTQQQHKKNLNSYMLLKNLERTHSYMRVLSAAPAVLTISTSIDAPLLF